LGLELKDKDEFEGADVDLDVANTPDGDVGKVVDVDVDLDVDNTPEANVIKLFTSVIYRFS
jgi:hypothetical protein